MKNLSKIYDKRLNLFFLMLLSAGAAGKLPDVQDPSLGKQKGFLATLQAYVYDGGALGGILLVSCALFVAGRSIVVEYGNIGDGKGSWTKLILLTLIGALLVIACIYFVSVAIETIEL
ncbi:MAG: TIGR03745 family integrating conjugative element membrane protein [Gilliamella apicola]|nr:TIGR03745 family integrating conjugative element membrane protein [Gilliamella apicola]